MVSAKALTQAINVLMMLIIKESDSICRNVSTLLLLHTPLSEAS